MTSFIGNINSAMIKLTVYYAVNMRIRNKLWPTFLCGFM